MITDVNEFSWVPFIDDVLNQENFPEIAQQGSRKV